LGREAVRGDDDEGHLYAFTVDVDHWIAGLSETGWRRRRFLGVDIRVLPGGEYRNSWLPSKA
jgi:hypothetical protein